MEPQVSWVAPGCSDSAIATCPDTEVCKDPLAIKEELITELSLRRKLESDVESLVECDPLDLTFSESQQLQDSTPSSLDTHLIAKHKLKKCSGIVKRLNCRALPSGSVSRLQGIKSQDLIEEVRKRPHLYEFTSFAHRDRPLKDKAWLEVAFVLNSDASTCETKWKSLRDTFMRKVREETESSRSGAGAKARPWHLMETMSFLRDVVRSGRRPSHSNIDQISTSSSSSLSITSQNYSDQSLHSPSLHISDDEMPPEFPPDQLNSLPTCSSTLLRMSRGGKTRATSASQEVLADRSAPSRMQRGGAVRRSSMTMDDPDSTPAFPRSSAKLRKKSGLTDQDFLEALNKQPAKMAIDEDASFCNSLIAPLQRLTSRNKALAKIKILTLLTELEFGDDNVK